MTEVVTCFLLLVNGDSVTEVVTCFLLLVNGDSVTEVVTCFLLLVNGDSVTEGVTDAVGVKRNILAKQVTPSVTKSPFTSNRLEMPPLECYL